MDVTIHAILTALANILDEPDKAKLLRDFDATCHDQLKEAMDDLNEVSFEVVRRIDRLRHHLQYKRHQFERHGVIEQTVVVGNRGREIDDLVETIPAKLENIAEIVSRVETTRVAQGLQGKLEHLIDVLENNGNYSRRTDDA